MARDVEALVLLMDANINKFIKKMDDADRKFDKTAKSIERRQRELDKRLATLGGKAADFARPFQIGAGLALGAITALSYEAAKRAQAVDGAFDQIFRAMPQKAAASASAIANEFGRLETDIKDNFTQIGGVMAGLGVDSEQALAIIDQLQRRALDLAAFRDVEDADAFRAVISGITGETEPLKRFGIVVNDTATKAELLRLGFKGNAQQAPEAAKAIARANLILAKSAEIHGQVAREAGNLTEKEKRTRAEFVKAAEDFGQQFLPVAAEVLEWASAALSAFNDLPTGTQNAALGLLALVAVGGPIVSVIKGLKDLILAAAAAKAAMAGLGTGTAGAGRGGVGGVVGRGLGGTLGRAALGTGILIGTASFAPAPYRGDDADLQLEQAQRDQRQARALANDTFLKSSSVVEDQRRRAAQADARVASLQRQAQQRQQAAARTEAARIQTEADAAASTALAGVGNFQLGGNQLTPVAGGSGTGGRGGSGTAEADRLAERRETLALERAIDLARASGDEKSVRAAEERQRLAQLTGEYEQAGYADAEGQALEHLSLLNAAEQLAEDRAKAEEQVNIILEGRQRQIERETDYAQLLNDQLLDRLGYEAQLAQLGGEDGAIRNAERRLFIEERTLEILRLKLATTEAEARAMAGGEFDEMAATENGRAMASSVVSFLRSDNIWEEAGRRFKDAAWDGVEDLLAQIFKGTSGSGGGAFAAIAKVFGFDQGGYTGPGARTAPAGVVHKGEVVFSQRDVARHGGVAAVEALRLARTGFANGGVVGVLPQAQAAMRSVGSMSGARPQDLTVRIDLDGANGDDAIREIAYSAAARGTMVALAQTRADANKASRRQRQRFV